MAPVEINVASHFLILSFVLDSGGGFSVVRDFKSFGSSSVSLPLASVFGE
jgi:hypothetical protein